MCISKFINILTDVDIPFGRTRAFINKTTTPWCYRNSIYQTRSISKTSFLQLNFSVQFIFFTFLLFSKTNRHKKRINNFSITMEDNHSPQELKGSSTVNGGADHGWQKVTYAKRQNKKKSNDTKTVANSDKLLPNGTLSGGDGVFHSLELHSEERRRRIAEARRAADSEFDDDALVRSKQHRRDEYDDDDDDDDDEVDHSAENGKAEEEKKVKVKKPKKPKVTVAEAAAKIDSADLGAFLVDISFVGSYEMQQDIQMMRFADYFGRAFSAVSSSQFTWVKLFRESTVAKIADVPLSHLSDAVYKTSTDWINQRSPEALSSFVLWCLDSILADLGSQLTVAKGSKKAVQHVASKSQVAIFIVLAMVLRRKPDSLIAVLPALRENAKYQGQDKLTVIVWMIAQASLGDLSVGLYAWARNLLPIVNSKTGNPQSRDLVLQLVEKILSTPKARPILVNGAVRKGERLIPPSSFEILVRVTYPQSSARLKATERFEAIYPTLKEVSLGGSPGSKAMKQVSQQIFNFAIKAAGENNPELSKEAEDIFIWCLGQSTECYKHWGIVYEDNIKASVAILKKLSDEWKVQSTKLSPYEPLRETLKNFRQKNEKALATGTDDARQALFKAADKYSKLILGRVSGGHGCVTCLTFTVLAAAVGAFVLSPNMVEYLDFKKLPVIFNSQF
ncbi:putative transmembrane protein [Lupinus albus]|uniref:Putative transmembrane protein n=1 Tax=Lupinus albus TaxID=3870 RepID=A0A6A4PHW7_LUPAL|nr:putative transmembrane protein [Lupinus albus]